MSDGDQFALVLHLNKFFFSLALSHSWFTGVTVKSDKRQRDTSENREKIAQQ